MKVGAGSGILQFWHDRASLSPEVQAQTVNAPHSTTARLNYTVPANKAAILHSIEYCVRCSTVPTTPKYQWGQIEITPSGGGSQIFDIFFFNVRAAYDIENAFRRYELFLSAGDVVVFKTADLGIGGQMFWYITAQINEYTP